MIGHKDIKGLKKGDRLIGASGMVYEVLGPDYMGPTSVKILFLDGVIGTVVWNGQIEDGQGNVIADLDHADAKVEKK